MKINDIKFLPATNAVADVYAKATGMPFVGEMMVAAAGNGGEPTPPTPSVVESVTFYVEQDGDWWMLLGRVTFNQDFKSEYCETYPEFTLDIKDSSNNYIEDSNNIPIVGLSDNIYCEIDVSEPNLGSSGTLTLPESGNYSIVVSNSEGTIYEGTGTWTYQDPQI